MSRLLPAITLGLMLIVISALPAPAQTAGYDLGIVRAGMPLAELRRGPWPPGARLLCANDPDLPATIEAPARNGIALPPRFSGLGIVACALFAKGGDGTWTLTTIPFAGHPAQLWVLGLAETSGGETKITQAKLWQADDALSDGTAAITKRLGPTASSTSNGSTWRRDGSEAIIGRVTSGGTLVVLTDTRLEKVLRARMGEGSTKVDN